MVCVLRFGRSLISRQSRNPSGCRPASHIGAKQTGRTAQGLAPNERAYTDFGERSKGQGENEIRAEDAEIAERKCWFTRRRGEKALAAKRFFSRDLTLRTEGAVNKGL